MSTDKRWMNNEWNGQNFVDSDSGLRHARAYNPANPAMTREEREILAKAINQAETELAIAAHTTCPDMLDDCDEHTGRLLLAIETMCAELRAGRANEALITGVMALGEHRARLIELSKYISDNVDPNEARRWLEEMDNPPTHIAALWENEKETGE